MDYVIVIERAADGTYSAYVPDLPGCVSSGDTLEELNANIAEAVRGHIESLRETGQPVPPPTSMTATVHAA
jgi:predicted RNase H-like HicB family nuclease